MKQLKVVIGEAINVSRSKGIIFKDNMKNLLGKFENLGVKNLLKKHILQQSNKTFKSSMNKHRQTLKNLIIKEGFTVRETFFKKSISIPSNNSDSNCNMSTPFSNNQKSSFISQSPVFHSTPLHLDIP